MRRGIVLTKRPDAEGGFLYYVVWASWNPIMIGYEDDAWSAVFQPPPDESAQERQARLARQHEAVRVSKEIDDAIEKSRKHFDRRRRAIKILLLGQAESGKSTMLRSAPPPPSRTRPPLTRPRLPARLLPHPLPPGDTRLEDHHPAQPHRVRPPPPPPVSPRSPPHSSVKRLLAIIDDELDAPSPALDDPPLTQAHSALRLRLLPLLSVETNLARQLLPEFGGASPPLSSSHGWAKWASGAGDHSDGFLFGDGEICVRAGGAWKNILARVTGPNAIPSTSKQPTRSARHHPSDPTPLLDALAPDIHALWTDPAIQALLRRKGVRMEHSAGFFLNDIMRIGKPGWNPDIGPCPHPLLAHAHLSQTTSFVLDSRPLA